MKNLLLLSMILSSVVASAATISNRAGTDSVVSACAEQDKDTGYCNAITLTRVSVDENGVVTKSLLTSPNGIVVPPRTIAKSFRQVLRSVYGIDDNTIETQWDVLAIQKDALAEFNQDIKNVETEYKVDPSLPPVEEVPLSLIASADIVTAYVVDGALRLSGAVVFSAGAEVGVAAGGVVIGAKELGARVASQKIRLAFHKMYKNQDGITTLSDRNYQAFLKVLDQQ